MGYTHYVERPVKNAGSAYMFGKLALDAKKLCDYANANGIRIRNGEGLGEPEFTEFDFSINGDAEGFTDNGRDLAHETFYWAGIPTQPKYREGEPEFFSFCKTAYKPYDAVITAILIRAKHIYGSCVRISSDGDWDGNPNFPDGYGSWENGRELYETVFGERAECPFETAQV
jgi:hypothetical protein